MSLANTYPKTGFTLLEVCLVIAMALIMTAVAVPSLTGDWLGNKEERRFADFDAMVREAHSRSLEERRSYVMIWGADGIVRLRPEEPANRKEAEGVRQWKIEKRTELKLRLPAALTAKGASPDAVWTFWADGVCEPAQVRYKDYRGGWKADYVPFKAQAEVRYD
jgi:competence protein ComGC